MPLLDFHNHLMPGVDDGAETVDESRRALAAMQAQGILTIITTPHIRASLLDQPAALERYMDRVNAGWLQLTALAAAEFPSLRLERGFEIMLDVPRMDLSDPRLRLAGGKFVLVEFPFFTIPPNSAQALFDIRMAGYVPVVAHPERYTNVSMEWEAVAAWRNAGGFLQVNAGSLVGQYGKGPEETAWRLLGEGWADYLCSDYHARGDCPTGAVCGMLKEDGGESQAELLTAANPDGIVAGIDPEPVERLQRRGRSWWKFGGTR